MFYVVLELREMFENFLLETYPNRIPSFEKKILVVCCVLTSCFGVFGSLPIFLSTDVSDCCRKRVGFFVSDSIYIVFLMVFFVIGLGLGDVEDITVRGLNCVKSCDRVYLEAYTSILCYGLDKSKLEEFYGKEVICADREMVEQRSGMIYPFAESVQHLLGCISSALFVHLFIVS